MSRKDERGALPIQVLCVVKLSPFDEEGGGAVAVEFAFWHMAKNAGQ